MRLLSILIGISLPVAAVAADVSVSRTTFNPSAHESVTYRVKITEPGKLTARILDRDSYVTKTIFAQKPVQRGETTIAWDGKDDQGRVVADEAWSLRLDFDGKSPWIYFPASMPQSMSSLNPDFFDRSTGILRYTLPNASRVHLQAGIADRSAQQATGGAVMKTIVNRAPRPAGSVIEQWNGMDESGTTYVPALQNFVVAIAATPLPENSVITYGNRQRDFLADAIHRGGSALMSEGAHVMHAHHQGLTALDDATPRLNITIAGGHFDTKSKTWRTKENALVMLDLDGPTVSRFETQPARLIVYVDQIKVIERKATAREVSVKLPRGREHVVAVNWVSDFGPVAATTFRAVAD